MRVAIVTGATGGIGSEFCIALDSKGLDGIVVLGRNLDALRSVERELSTKMLLFQIDLTDRASLHGFESELLGSDYEIEYLVN